MIVSFKNSLQFIVLLNISTCLCMSESKLSILTPTLTPRGFLRIQAPPTSPLMKAVSRNANTKMLSNPLRKMAEDVKNLIEEYTKRRDLAQKRGVENRYDELLKDANDLAKEIEDASQKYDELRLEQSQKGSAESGAQADRLTEIIQNRTEPFKSLLWRMDQVIAEIQNERASVSNRPAYEELPPTATLVSRKSRTPKPEEVATKDKRFGDDGEEESLQTQKTLQPLKTKGTDLDELNGQVG